MENEIAHNRQEQKVPALLLHSCCAPCSSYCLETLSEDFAITVFYYNPNIYPEDEYWKRVREQERFIGLLPAKHKISFLEGNYEKERFYETVKGLERSRRVESAVLPVIVCGCRRRSKRPRRADLTM